MEGRRITYRGWVKGVNGSEDGVRVDSGTTTAGVGGVVTAGRVFVGLEWLVRETVKGWLGENAYLLET